MQSSGAEFQEYEFLKFPQIRQAHYSWEVLNWSRGFPIQQLHPDQEYWLEIPSKTYLMRISTRAAQGKFSWGICTSRFRWHWVQPPQAQEGKGATFNLKQLRKVRAWANTVTCTATKTLLRWIIGIDDLPSGKRKSRMKIIHSSHHSAWHIGGNTNVWNWIFHLLNSFLVCKDLPHPDIVTAIKCSVRARQPVTSFTYIDASSYQAGAVINSGLWRCKCTLGEVEELPK